jgi:hypothetical protein
MIFLGKSTAKKRVLPGGRTKAIYGDERML